ncbi:hypothetical protein [Sporolactobacillus inulinus]|uniref:hypothetical protein n=1 Tax=Sporolactobacillus inulinus TaxID=2078 RepID=UPI0021CCA823|nr:hypothetical protein [Sporolactobacillus inulinus]
MNLLIAQMQEDDFPNYLAHTSQEYAKEKTKTGTWPADQALILAQAEIRSLLPQGMHTPNHHFCHLLMKAESNWASFGCTLRLYKKKHLSMTSRSTNLFADIN